MCDTAINSESLNGKQILWDFLSGSILRRSNSLRPLCLWNFQMGNLQSNFFQPLSPSPSLPFIEFRKEREESALNAPHQISLKSGD